MHLAIPWGVENICAGEGYGDCVAGCGRNDQHLQLDSGTIRLVVGRSSIVITDGQITIRSPQVTIQANRIDDEGL